MSTQGAPGLSNTDVFIAAVNSIISRKGDFFDDGIVQVIDLREGEDDISVSVALDSAKRPNLRRSQLRLDVSMNLEEIHTVTLDGREIPGYMLNRDADFAEAAAKVRATSDKLLEQGLEAIRDEAIREEWAESDAAEVGRQHEMDELSIVIENGVGNPHRRFSRRQIDLELDRLTAETDLRHL